VGAKRFNAGKGEKHEKGRFIKTRREASFFEKRKNRREGDCKKKGKSSRGRRAPAINANLLQGKKKTPPIVVENTTALGGDSKKIWLESSGKKIDLGKRDAAEEE